MSVFKYFLFSKSSSSLINLLANYLDKFSNLTIALSKDWFKLNNDNASISVVFSVFFNNEIVNGVFIATYSLSKIF